MNKIVLEQLDENKYSKNHLNLTIEGTNKTLLIEKDKIKNIEIIRHYKVFDNFRYEFIFSIEGKVFSFKTNVIEYYEPLLLGCEYSDNAKFNKNSEQISRTLDKTGKNLKGIKDDLIAQGADFTQYENMSQEELLASIIKEDVERMRVNE